jgi:hypothetical protein
VLVRPWRRGRYSLPASTIAMVKDTSQLLKNRHYTNPPWLRQSSVSEIRLFSSTVTGTEKCFCQNGRVVGVIDSMTRRLHSLTSKCRMRR